MSTGGKHSAADVVAKAQAILSEPAMLRAMFDSRIFPAEHAAVKSLPDDRGEA